MGSYHPSRWASRLEVSPLFCRASHRLSTNRLHGEMLEPRAVPSFGVAGLAAPETSNATSVAAVNPTPGNSSLSGNVYLDLNDNGVFDSGESGIDGVTVTLTGTDRNGFFVQVSQVTDANGRFQFLGLNPGVYQIEQIQPAGYVDRWDRVGSLGGITENDRFVQIVVEPGQAGEGYDFGERPAGDSSYRLYVAGYIYIDINNNGIRDAGSEPGLPGKTVVLQGASGYSATVTTDEFGKYIFVDMPAGTYSIIEIQPPGFLDGIDTVGTLYGGTSGPIGTDRFDGLVLPVAPLLIGDHYNFGELVPGEIAGHVFVDANDNGKLDPSEEGIAGVLVTLRGVNDLGETIVQTSRTNADGSFRFTGLRPGMYSLEDQQPEGFTDGKRSVGTKGGRIEGNRVVDIPVDGWTKAERYGFGKKRLPRTSSIAGFVYNDRNNNGIKDPNEAGIPGVEIILIGGGRQWTATTGPDGSFLFVVDRPGTYTLIENLDERERGLFDGKDTFGTTFRGTADNDRMTIFVEAGKSGRDFLFGELTVADMVASETNSGNRPRENSQPPTNALLAGAIGLDLDGPARDLVDVNGPSAVAAGQRSFANNLTFLSGVEALSAGPANDQPTDSGAITSDPGAAVRVNELFGGEVPVVEDEQDERLSESMAGTLLTGGRLQTQAGLRRGTSLGSVAVLTQTDADSSATTEESLRPNDDFPLLQCLIGLDAPAIRPPKGDPGNDPSTGEAEKRPADEAVRSAAEGEERPGVGRRIAAASLTSGAVLVAGKLAYDWRKGRQLEEERRRRWLHRDR